MLDHYILGCQVGMHDESKTNNRRRQTSLDRLFGEEEAHEEYVEKIIHQMMSA